jgi:hypothetical protein
VLEPEIREHRGLIDMTGNLLDAASRGDVLGACELRAATLTRKAQQVLGDEWHRSARAFLPRCVGG